MQSDDSSCIIGGCGIPDGHCDQRSCAGSALVVNSAFGQRKSRNLRLLASFMIALLAAHPVLACCLAAMPAHAMGETAEAASAAAPALRHDCHQSGGLAAKTSHTNAPHNGADAVAHSHGQAPERPAACAVWQECGPTSFEALDAGRTHEASANSVRHLAAITPPDRSSAPPAEVGVWRVRPPSHSPPPRETPIDLKDLILI